MGNQNKDSLPWFYTEKVESIWENFVSDNNLENYVDLIICSHENRMLPM